MPHLLVRRRQIGPQLSPAIVYRKRQEPEELTPPPQQEVPIPPPVKVENTHTIEIERFIPQGEIDPRYFDAPYYVAPRDEVGQEAYTVIRDAMAAKSMVGMGRVVLSKRDRPIMIMPRGKGLLGMTLHYAHEVRSEADYFCDIQDMILPADMLQIAERIVEMKTAKFDPALLEDRYRTVLVSMLRAKQAKLPQKPDAVAPKPQNVIDLMEVLKRSISAEKPPGAEPPPKSASRRVTETRKMTSSRRSHPRARKAG
jgi:DNA end-binding protein Ku